MTEATQNAPQAGNAMEQGAPGPQTLIRLRGLEKAVETRAGKTWILRRIDLDIRDGEFVTIMGPSGAGKSTLLGILGMLDDGWEGAFWLAGEPVHTLARKRRQELAKQSIGFVFQQYHLLDDLTVAENLDVPLQYRNVKSAERQAPGRRHARPLRHRGQEGSLPEPALRRPAAAGRCRPRDDRASPS